MDKLQKIKELLNGLSQEEIAEVKTFLESDVEDVEDSEKEVEETVTDDSETKTETENEETETSTNTEEEAPAEPTEQETPVENLPVEETISTEESEKEEPSMVNEPGEETSFNESEKEAVADENTSNKDDTPKMQKGVPYNEEDAGQAVTENITADTGEEIPVDYQEIIAGLNAKLEAQNAEIKMLKSKYEGAFGFSAKSAIPAKVNSLYDDALDVHFRK